MEIISPPPENLRLVNCLDFEVSFEYEYFIFIITIKIKPGMNTMFMGPLGCGKTALFRILAGLWPLKEGKLQRPKIEKISFASQRPYFPEGTLRDEIIYPDNLMEMRKKEIKDEDLQKILEEIGLHYLVDKFGGFEAFDDWNEALDGFSIFY